MATLNKHFSPLALSDTKQAIEKADNAYELALRSHVEEYYQDDVSLVVRARMIAESLVDSPRDHPQTDATPTEIEVLEKILDEYC